MREDLRAVSAAFRRLTVLGVALVAGASLVVEVLPGVGGSDPSPPIENAADSAAAPSPRVFQEMAYDSESDRVILFGGFTGTTVLGDTWAYDFDTNTWTDMNPATSPERRSSHAMAYDAKSDRVVLFGGVSNVGGTFRERNDTWAYDYNANLWVRMNPPTAPPPRQGHRMVYDAESDRTIIVGGHIGRGTDSVLVKDVWAYDLNADTWTNMTPAQAFFGADQSGFAYDAESDRSVLFGGLDEVGGFSDTTRTYDFNANTWTALNPGVRPSGRWLFAMAYDAKSDRIVLYGGEGGLDETWVYNLNANAWTRMDPSVRPSGRISHRMAYDSQSDRLILFGGEDLNSVAANNETWAYDVDTNTWTPLTLPSAPASLRATAGDGRVDLVWSAPGFDGGTAIAHYRVYRGASSGSPPLLAEIGNDTSYADTRVTVGVTYYYRVSAVNGVGEGPLSNEASATPSATPGPPPPDTTRPSIAITSPVNGATVDSSTVNVAGTASDNVGVEKVEISWDAATWTPATGTATWSGVLTLVEGANVIYARATDTSGNSAITNISVTVQVPVPPSGPSGPALSPSAVAAIAAAVAVAAGASGFIFLRRRRSK